VIVFFNISTKKTSTHKLNKKKELYVFNCLIPQKEEQSQTKSRRAVSCPYSEPPNPHHPQRTDTGNMTDIVLITGISYAGHDDERDPEKTFLPRIEQPKKARNLRGTLSCKILPSWTFINGFCLGFCIQTVSLGSTAILAIHWGGATLHWVSKQDEVYYVLFFVLSQSWWLLFPIICCTIDGVTAHRCNLFQRVFFSQSKLSSRRDVFLGGVRFHVGIVVGCFLVWALIDLYFGASRSVLVTLLFSFLACLYLCYAMVFVHDRYNTESEELP
jgi:hypothetical protein